MAPISSPNSTISWSAPIVVLVAIVSGAICACEYPEVLEQSSVQSRSNGAFLWRGFDHRWSYNHRLKRLGDFLSQEGCTSRGATGLPAISCRGSSHHTAAAGTGSDRASFTSHYTETSSPNTTYHSARATLSFEGRERSELRRTLTAEIPVESGGEFVALLNGYDLRTVGSASAKKLKRFRVWVSEAPEYDSEDKIVRVDVGGVLDVNCQSAECLTQLNRVHYRLDVEVLVVRSPVMHSNTRRFETSYRWDRERELQRDHIALNRQRQSISGRPQTYQLGLVGFRAVDFDLAIDGGYEDHWFVEWEQSITGEDYRRHSGRISFDLTLFFKEWNAKSKKELLSLAGSGEATLSSDVTLVQLPRGGARRDSQSGTLRWEGKTRTSRAPSGNSWNSLGFEF